MDRVLAATEVAYELATSFAPLPNALKQNAIEMIAISHYIIKHLSIRNYE